MEILKLLFKSAVGIFKFINTYFKTMIFLLILFLVFENKKPQIANLAQINLNGAITNNSAILDEIYKINEDENIKGVLLYIDSPGGALAPSVELYAAIKNLKVKKPVIAYAGGSMTSGSYYAGVAADRIIANKGSFIGSIGVIMQGVDISELATKIGISQQIVKAGVFKEAGTLARKWNEAEKMQLQNLVDQSYAMFLADVAASRNLNLEKSDEWANARIFLADEALKVGLIDELGDYYSVKKQVELISKVSKPIWLEKPLLEKILNERIDSVVRSFVGAIARIGAR